MNRTQRTGWSWVGDVLVAVLSTLASALAQGDAAAGKPLLTHGPLRGHTDATSMHVWARASEPGEYTLQLAGAAGGSVASAAATASAANDLTLHFTVNGLAAAAVYSLRVLRGEQVVHTGASPWTTGLRDDAASATIAFGSCANDKALPEQPIWERIVAQQPHALVLLGDTPYVDLGTVEARRQRHRDFFAFAPVQAALAAIPTWTTWDDHDYAFDNAFGAVPGSETARPVFVDYHAHASYGDGERGIHTRFRQGPIEVFLLDTRTFADGGESVFAPGERSLLGKAQSEWLQAGLLASTAPIKVLACGMVWNGGVREGKQDCWGNWLAERDALFRWLGTQGVDGVVLVGGDVHRSRVIVHPTKAVAGYDLVEFVTSPLAANVIEANKVDVPGLSFDAGEPHSCLFLTATMDDGVPSLRATFRAGDGREFHTRTLDRSALARPDAAPAYRRIAASMHAQFGESMEPLLDPEAGPLELSEASAVGDAWRAATAAAAPAFAQWRVAVAEPRCRFRATSREPLSTEFQEELLLPLSRLRRLVIARALQALADGDASTAVATIGDLLAHARHLQQEPALLAWAIAAGTEKQVAVLHELLRERMGPDAAERSRVAIAQHLQSRAQIAALGDAARIETFRMFDASIAQMRLGKDATAEAARTLGAEIRRAFTDLVDPMLAVVENTPDAWTGERKAAFDEARKALIARKDERMQVLKALMRGKAPPAGFNAAPDLGLMLATLMMPSADGVAAEHDQAGERLRAAIR